MVNWKDVKECDPGTKTTRQQTCSVLFLYLDHPAPALEKAGLKLKSSM